MEQVDLFLTEIADAVLQYGDDRIVNMDETFVTTRNLCTRVIGLKAKETIKVTDEKLNIKEGTTFIGTVSMDPNNKIPLGVIAKGKTTRCEKKYGTENMDEFITHSNSGWMTPAVMKAYLNWLSKKMGNGPFVLILDVYRAHIEKSVRDHASKLGIKLIFVPACATGIYQPLDRRLYGIVKKQLISKDRKYEVASDHERWSTVLREMKEIWEELSEEAIRSAWEIPGLDDLKKIDDVQSDTSDEDWIPNENE